jgi:hypothetical protein
VPVLVAPPRPMPSTPPTLPKHNRDLRLQREAIVRAWMQNRVATWPADKAPPTGEADILDAKTELEGMGIPEQMIQDARWIGWKRLPGRPRKIRQV